MTQTSTATTEMADLLTELKVPAKKAESIMQRFGQLLADAQTPDVVFVAGSRPAVEHVEIYGLSIGIDACGNAATVEPVMPGLPQGFDLPELEYGA